METLALWLHIVASAAWLGGNLMALLLPGLLAPSGPPAMLALGRANLVLSRIFFIPAALLTLVTGIWLVVLVDYGWGDTFVTVGFTAVIVIAFGSLGVLVPTGKKMLAAMEAGDGPTAQSLAPRQRYVSTINALVLLVTIYAMVARWGA